MTVNLLKLWFPILFLKSFQIISLNPPGFRKDPSGSQGEGLCWSCEKSAPNSYSGTFWEGMFPTSQQKGIGKGCWDEVLNELWGLSPAKAFYWTI